MRRTLLMALLCSALVCTTAFAGSITGTITYDGNVPKLKPYDMNADPVCAEKHAGGKAANPFPAAQRKSEQVSAMEGSRPMILRRKFLS